MKISTIPIAAAFCALVITCSPEKKLDSHSVENSKPVLDADTIQVQDDFALNPFLFKEWGISLDSVLLHLPDNVRLETVIEQSEYYENANDTITRIWIKDSVIEHIKTPQVSYIESALISDSTIGFAKGIRIGDQQSIICNKFPRLQNHCRPYQKIIVYSEGDAASYVYLEFKDNKLYKLIFWPYTG